MNKKLLGLVGLVGVGVAAYFLLSRNKQVSVSSSANEAATPTVIYQQAPQQTTGSLIVTPTVVVPNVTNTYTSTYAPSQIYAPTTTITTSYVNPSTPTNDDFTQGLRFTDLNRAMGASGEGVLGRFR